MISNIVATILISGGQQGLKTSDVSVNDLSFMAGAWTAEIWGGIFEEHWLPAVGGTMQSVGRFISKGKVDFMEFASIEMGEKGLVMWMILGAPSKSRGVPKPFALSNLKDLRVVFTNKENDYPTNICYEPGKAGMLICTLEGKENGKEKTEVFNFRRMKP